MGELAANLPLPTPAQSGNIAWFGLIVLCIMFLAIGLRG